MQKISLKGKIEGTPLVFETGQLAFKSLASVKTMLGETVVLTLVNVGNVMEDATFLPLTIDYIEKLYAGGLISGARFLKREIRPTDEEVIKARVIDHAIRSLFSPDFFHQVQVVNIVLSYDGKNDPGLAATLGSSASLMISGLPFKGPLGSLKIGLRGGNPIFHLPDDEDETSDLIMRLSVTEKGITSVELEANEMAEDVFSEVVQKGYEKARELIKFQNEFVRKVGVRSFTYVPNTKIDEASKAISASCKKDIEKIIESGDSIEIQNGIDALIEKVKAENEGKISANIVQAAVWATVKRVVREFIKRGKRIGGRKVDEMRPLHIETGVLPRTHGSAIFQRGLTQVLSTVTLGSTRFEQTLQSLTGEETRRFMHHYNMPGYATGEIDQKIYIPSRRSIGHGAIGENALKRMIPAQDVFPYTIRVVSEVLSSDGSTSMASTCCATLALMDAGVKIKSPVAGISVGLVYEKEDSYVLLTDITGLEDACGDMDFKIAGTKNGITAVQLDNKIGGIPFSVLRSAVIQSREARLKILDEMNKVMPAPRKDLSQYAPKISTIKIDPKKIGDLIGPGGKVIKGIIEATGVEIDIQEDGTVAIASTDENMRKEAEVMIHNITDEPEIGKEYEGKVDRIESYGIFVSVSRAISGLVHISEISDRYIPDLQKIFKVGDRVNVKIISVDEQGRVNFTMKGVAGNDEIEKKIAEISTSTFRPRQRFNSGGIRKSSSWFRTIGGKQGSRYVRGGD